LINTIEHIPLLKPH